MTGGVVALVAISAFVVVATVGHGGGVRLVMEGHCGAEPGRFLQSVGFIAMGWN